MPIALLTTALFLGADDDGRAAFQGTWTIVKMERGKADNKAAAQPVSAATVVFAGDRYTIKQGNDAVEEGAFAVEAGKTPNRIRVEATSGEDKGTKWHGIYELEGNTLRAVVGPTDREPLTMLTKPDPGTRAFTLKRAAK